MNAERGLLAVFDMNYLSSICQRCPDSIEGSSKEYDKYFRARDADWHRLKHATKPAGRGCRCRWALAGKS